MKLFAMLLTLVISTLIFAKQDDFIISSPAFSNNGTIPNEFCFKGKNISPPLIWSNGSNKVKSYALIVIDFDAKKSVGHPVAHWVVFNIPTKTKSLNKGEKNINEGLNSYNKMGYIGMNPPRGQKHAYHFYLYGLDVIKLKIPKTPTYKQLNKAMHGHVIERATMLGYFEQ